MNKMEIGDIFRTTEICIKYPMKGNYVQYTFKDEVENFIYVFFNQYEKENKILNIDFNTGLSGDYVRITFNNDMINEIEMIKLCNELVEFLNNEMFIERV